MTDVQAELDALRRDIYRGRGPVIGERERSRHTTLRPRVGHLPTAWLREELRLRTMRARGEDEAAGLEEEWAREQCEAGTTEPVGGNAVPT